MNNTTQISYYNEIEKAWQEELERTTALLKCFGKDYVFDGQIQYMKLLVNRIKRCKWNITRAKNLRKQFV